MLQQNSIAAKTRAPITPSALLSATIHVIALLGILGVLHSGQKVAPYKIPGTAQGITLLTYYAPGSPAQAVNDVPVKQTIKPTSAATLHSPVAPPKPKEPAAPAAETGTGSSPESGLGEGDIRIAFQTFSPHPTPDLPHGIKGDVILNAVIDEHGKIADLTLLKGLGPAIDDTVIATVKQWSFTPATRNGIPIPSEQELHFHYERS
jgi:protein TonB